MGLGFMFTVVHIYSTIGVRLIFWCAAFAFLAAVWLVTRQVTPQRYRSLAFACVAATLVAIVLWRLRSMQVGFAAGALTWLLVMANMISTNAWNAIHSRPLLGRLASLGFWFGVGIEAVLPRPFLIWYGRNSGRLNLWGGPLANRARFIPGAALAAALIALLLPHPVLMQIGQSMFMSRQVSIVFGPQYSTWSPYDVSDIAWNPDNGDLFLCGDGQGSPKVLRGGAGPALDIGISNADNEFCEFSQIRQRFLTVNNQTDELLLVDPGDFSISGHLYFEDLPYGEILLAAHPGGGLLAVASENERRDPNGVDIRIVDLDTLEVIREIAADTGYIITHPEHPVIYVNHFAMDIGVRAFDMHSGELLANSSLFGRSDRMAFDVKRDEVLATAPESGQIRRFDATTLIEKNPIDTVLGARGLAIDAERDLLLVSSFLTNKVDVIDLKTGRSLRRYRLGPWMRDVLVLSDEGVAYVASRYAVYRLNYLQ